MSYGVLGASSCPPHPAAAPVLREAAHFARPDPDKHAVEPTGSFNLLPAFRHPETFTASGAGDRKEHGYEFPP